MSVSYKKQFENIHENAVSPDGIPIILQENRPYNKPWFIHAHDNFELGICLSGSGVFFVEDEIYPFAAGDVSIIYPGEFHIAQNIYADPSDWYFISVDIERLYSSSSSDTLNLFKHITEKLKLNGGIIHRDGHEDIVSCVKRLSVELIAAQSGYEMMAKSILCEIFVLLSRYEIRPDAGFKETEKASDSMTKAAAYIMNNYASNVSSQTLASLCNMSEVHMRRKFKEKFGVSPYEYLCTTRINKACAMLRSDNHISIADIAISVGYTTLSSFNRHFHRFVGMTPTEYSKLVFTQSD